MFIEGPTQLFYDTSKLFSMMAINKQKTDRDAVAADRKTLLNKVTITLVRTLLYAYNIQFSNLPISTLLTKCSVALGLYTAASVVIWGVSLGFSRPKGQFKGWLTLILHLFGLANLILLTLSVKLQETHHQQSYYQRLTSQMLNYVLTLFSLSEIFTHFIVKNFKVFLQAYQCVQNSLIFLFMAHLVGTLLDFFNFARIPVRQLYLLGGIALVYVLTQFSLIKWLKQSTAKLKKTA